MNLVDNGLDSLRKALLALFNMDNIKDSEDFALKDIIINFHHSIEVLFKYLVSEKNKFLIYENQELIFKFHAQERISQRKTGNNAKNNMKKAKVDIRTISFLDSLHRIIVLYNVDIDEYTYGQFVELNKLRNELTHHECELNISEVEHMIAHILPVVTDRFKHIEKFNRFIADEKMTLKINNLYTERYIWKFVTLIRLTENSNVISAQQWHESDPFTGSNIYDKQYYGQEDLHLLGFEKSYFCSVDNFINQLFEDLVFNRVNKELLLSLKENTKLSAWLSGKERVICDLAIRTIHEKISTAMLYVLEETHQNLDEIIKNRDLEFLKNTFKQSKLSTKIAIADCMNVVKQMISDLKKFMPVKEICNKRCVLSFNKLFPMPEKSFSKIELEFSIKEYLELCRDLLRDDQILYEDTQNEFAMIKEFIDSTVYEKVNEVIQDSIWEGDISIKLRNVWGERGYVERTNYFEFWTSYLIKSPLKDSYYLITGNSVSTETYSDHDYYYNGSVEFYLGFQILINWEEKSVQLKDMSFIDFYNDAFFIA